MAVTLPLDEQTADAQDVLNAAFYRSALVTRSYPKEGLDAQETITLLKYQADFVGRDVLDVGVGTGRTASILAPLARRYVAIDYSPLMVDQLHGAMPHLELHVEDMRNLGRFGDATFDSVLAPNNVIDAVSHADRLETLREAWRVLRPGGLLAFTSHNRRYVAAYGGPRLRRSRNPVTFALHVVHYLRSLRVHARMKPLRRFEEDYALLDDSAPDHALLHYHVDRVAQQRHLAELGFVHVDVIDKWGKSLGPCETAPASSCLMYVARKA